MREITIFEPLYQVNITYIAGCTIPKLLSILKERHGDSPTMSWSEEFKWGKDADTTDGYQFHINAPYGKGETFYVWMHNVTPSLLFHETFHLVGDILHTRGVVYSNTSEEAFAYLGGWIFQKVSKLML